MIREQKLVPSVCVGNRVGHLERICNPFCSMLLIHVQLKVGTGARSRKTYNYKVAGHLSPRTVYVVFLMFTLLSFITLFF
jgi:hypothetical protein